jgi:hypothetical protein
VTRKQQRSADSLEERLEVQRLRQEEFNHRLKKPNGDNALIGRLERQVDTMLAEAAGDPSRITPQLNQEIEHLDEQIEMLWLNAMKDASGGRPASSDQGGMWPPDTEYYRNPDWLEGEVAK